MSTAKTAYKDYLATVDDGTATAVDGAFADAGGAKLCAITDGEGKKQSPGTAHTTLYENIAALADCEAKAKLSKENLAFQYHEDDAKCTVIKGFDAISGNADGADGFVCHVVKDITARAAKAKAWYDAVAVESGKMKDLDTA